MKYTKYFAGFALAVGLLAAGTNTASAQQWHDRSYARQDYRQDVRQDLRRDYRRVAEMRERVARDRARLAEDIRCGNRTAAYRDRMELARDERALEFQLRDIRHDRYDNWR